jgi:hypothetical protein
MIIKLMLKKIFKEKWFVWTIHIAIIIGLFFNCFYVLENFKVSKNNQRIIDQKTQLEQDKKNLLDQNSFEFLESFKDKTIKKAGFKNTGEEVFDIGSIDSKKDDKTTQNINPNYEKWYKCLFTDNFSEKIIENNQQIVLNNLCK